MDQQHPPAVDRPRRWWRWVLLAPCGCLVLALIPVGVGVFTAPQFIGLIADALRDAREFRGRMLDEALASGDTQAAYEQADQRFRAAYPQDRLAEFLQEHPALFDPPGNTVAHSDRTHNGESCVATAYESDGVDYVIYVTRDGETLRLLGLRPGLEDAVPPGLRYESDAGE